jgi:hypothetical protein
MQGGTFAIVAHPDDVPMHPRLRHLFAHWRAAAPASGLPSRSRFEATPIADLTPDIWVLDVQRTPLRLRYASCGARIVAALGHDPTGRWLDEVHPRAREPNYYDRYRVMVEQGVVTWRKGRPAFWHEVKERGLENLIVPLADDGRAVDRLVAMTVLYDDVAQTMPVHEPPAAAPKP